MSSEQTMVERVARACWQTQTIRPWEDAHEDEREEMIGYARAAIEAMREPTDAMLVAGAKAGDAVQNGELWPEASSVGLVFFNMIDAALNEDAS